MIFTKKQAQDAQVYASKFSVDLRSKQAREYMNNNNLTNKQYKNIVVKQIKENKKVDPIKVSIVK